MSDYRDVAFSGGKIKLTDFLKAAGLAKDGPMGGNAKDIVEMGFVMVDGEISRPSGLGGINKRTKLSGGEIVTRFGLTDDPDDPRIIVRDREEGPHLGRSYRYPSHVVRAVAS